jgi:uncharacterized membrane protein YkvA (DUF1232 family)
MGAWQWALVGLVALLLAYGVLIVALIARGRRADAAAVARFIPDCIVLVRGLAADPRVPRSSRLMLLGLAAYLVLPIDLVPDFIPIAGQLDDAILVIAVLSWIVRSSGAAVIAEHWRGADRPLQMLLRLASGR